MAFRGDQDHFRPPSESFQCGEQLSENEEDVGACVTFYCTVAPNTHNIEQLLFTCREPSCGVLVGDEPKAEKVEDDAVVDPFLFDPGYTLAGKTGFQVWPGSRLLVEALTFPQSSDGPELISWQRTLAKGTRVLELGAGVGLVGISLALAGAQVLMTDLPTLVEYSLGPNLLQNETESPDNQKACDECPSWLTPSNAVRVGKGWVGVAALDWTQPLEKQLSTEQSTIDLVVASDCVWLVSMLDGLLSTVASIFSVSTSQQGRHPKFLMSFQRRDPPEGQESTMFTTVDRVLTEIKARQWTVKCLAWHPVIYEIDGKKDDSKEVFLFEISPVT